MWQIYSSFEFVCHIGRRDRGRASLPPSEMLASSIPIGSQAYYTSVCQKEERQLLREHGVSRSLAINRWVSPHLPAKVHLVKLLAARADAA